MSTVTEYTRNLVANINYRHHQGDDFYALVDHVEMTLVNMGPERIHVISALPYELAFADFMIKVIFDRAVSRIYTDLRGEMGRRAGLYLVFPERRTHGG